MRRRPFLGEQLAADADAVELQRLGKYRRIMSRTRAKDSAVLSFVVAASGPSSQPLIARASLSSAGISGSSAFCRKAAMRSSVSKPSPRQFPPATT